MVKTIDRLIIRAKKKCGDCMARRKNLKLDSPQAVRKALSRVANMVLNGEIDTKSANSIILACNAILSGIRIDEQDKKLAGLEQILNERVDEA